MTNKFNDIVQDYFYSADFSGDFTYEAKQERPKIEREEGYFQYKVWNPNPQQPTSAPTPGVVLTRSMRQEDGTYEKTSEIVEKVRLVILNGGSSRKLSRGKGNSFKVVCDSDDGEHPSVRIQEPLNRKVTSDDLVQVFSKWRGFDEAKVKSLVDSVTTEGGRLSVCSLKTGNGFITLCPYAKRDPDTGQAAPCKEYFQLRAFDVERKRFVRIELSGKSIENSPRFSAPIHEFYRFLNTAGPIADGKPIPLPSFAFEVTFQPKEFNNFFLSDFTDYTPIEDKELREKYFGFAKNTKKKE